MIIRLLSGAKLDIELGYRFYESQRAGLGQYFVDCISTDIDSLLIYAGLHEKNRGLYRSLAVRFPFVIYYDLQTTEIIIYAVLDGRQNPRAINKILKHRKKD